MENASSNDEDVEHDKMISWKDEDGMEANGLRLSWGEYYVFGRDMSSDSDSSCDEEESDVSIEEAEEVTDEQLNEELDQARKQCDEEYKQATKDREQANKKYDSNDTEEKTCDPTLMGMPDILLEKILHFATERPSEVCALERVCKRIRRIARIDEFWARHPCYHDSRELSFIHDSIRQIRSYQIKPTNEILAVLGDETGGAADTLRTVAADLLSQMMYVGSDVPLRFRLRGDTVGYLAELLQEHMIQRLQEAVFMTIHSHRTELQKKDILFVLQKGFSSLPYFSGQEPISKCNVGMQEHGIVNTVVGCSCSFPSFSGTVWRWPSHDCHDVLPLEAGRRIIRRLAYMAGVREMSNEAFVLAEAELLHTMGLLLVDAYESSVEMAKSVSYLDTEEALVYRVPTNSIDMFKVPPPPLHSVADGDGEDEDLLEEPTYTIVPGQIRTSAKRRNVGPHDVYGDIWVASPGFTAEEEKGIEESYYYEAYCDDSSDIEHDEQDEDTGDCYECDSDYCCDDVDSCSSGDEDLDCSDGNMDWEELNNVRSEVVGRITHLGTDFFHQLDLND
eukprot:CAMPEP_0201918496 /NCGR_PEP_ID=MMETSP0903-20130614/7642_1 /ASSEMBLY_ACC=CAM_ASM_000552 /TAXON_ID=420261 /ORGANISM="Thalassiosira antarctica, Strain CCMP982" /LENGTH=561 /DNA_ID=CAMNT_0048454825 /DNA_START=201 /DNA_END=1886 /DNA_ORIENTATION=-